MSFVASTIHSSRWLLASAALSFVVACGAGCGDDGGANAPGRTFSGAVHIASGDGTQKTSLDVASGFPRVSLGALFFVEFAGNAAGVGHHLSATINPANEGERYEFPRDSARLVLAVERAGAAQPVGTVQGFVQITEADGASTYGAAVVSLSLFAVSGFALADIDVTFTRAPRTP